jgi:hypothetical protein
LRNATAQLSLLESKEKEFGKPSRYEAEPEHDSAYAIIALLPGLRPGRHCLIVAGTTTFGTLGVAEFVTRKDSLRPLLDRLGAGARGAVPAFEALFHVRSSNGVPIR